MTAGFGCRHGFGFLALGLDLARLRGGLSAVFLGFVWCCGLSCGCYCGDATWVPLFPVCLLFFGCLGFWVFLV